MAWHQPGEDWEIDERPAEKPCRLYKTELRGRCLCCNWSGTWTKYIEITLKEVRNHQRTHLPTRHDLISCDTLD